MKKVFITLVFTLMFFSSYTMQTPVLQTRALQTPSESELYVRDLMSTERGPSYYDYAPINSYTYEESSWFALRILLPVHRNSTWEYAEIYSSGVSAALTSPRNDADEKLKFLFKLKNFRPDLSYSQLATIYVLIDSVTDIDGNDLFDPMALNKYLALTYEGQCDETINPLNIMWLSIFEMFDGRKKTSWMHPFFSEVITSIERAGDNFVGYQRAFDIVINNVSSGIPIFRSISDLPRTTGRYISGGISGSIRVTGRAIVVHGDTVLDSTARAFGETMGKGLASAAAIIGLSGV